MIYRGCLLGLCAPVHGVDVLCPPCPALPCPAPLQSTPMCPCSVDGVMRTMNTEKLLKTIPIIQNQMDALLDFNVSDLKG